MSALTLQKAELFRECHQVLTCHAPGSRRDVVRRWRLFAESVERHLHRLHELGFLSLQRGTVLALGCCGMLRFVGAKGDAYIELVVAGWTGGTSDLGDALALSVARDAARLGIPMMPGAIADGALSTRLGPATLAELADIDFEAWDPKDCKIHTNEEWAEIANPHLITARLAWVTCIKTKVELVDMVRALPEEGDASVTDFEQRFENTVGFFEGYAALIKAAKTRIMGACAVLLREAGEPEAQSGYVRPVAAVAPDRRAVAAYREWLHMESRLLGLEMYPEAGDEADRFIPANTAAKHYHFPLGGGASWRDLPQPSTRAEAMCRVLGIDWTADRARDEHFLSVAPAAAAQTEAA